MEQTWRHFAALTRKNFIGMKRQPCTSVAQILLPGLLMLVVVWIRSKLEPFTVGGDAITLLKHGMYSMDVRNDENNISPVGSAERVGDFMLFNEHADIFNYGYNPTYDPFSPLFFNPTNCEKGHSFMVPQVAATIVAIVNDEPTNATEDREKGIVTNATLMEDMKDYLQTLNKWQLLRGTTDLNFEYKYYTTAELQEYVTSQEYLTVDDSTNTTYPGVCFGLQLTKFAEANYSAILFFDDQDDLGGSIATGIPCQYGGPGEGAGTPQVTAYGKYTQDGYTFLQNLIANTILRDSTDKKDAQIDMLAIPFQNPIIQEDYFTYVSEMFVPGFIFLIWILPTYNFVCLIVKEKETKAKETMRIMGMNDFSYWLSWFVYYTFVSTLVALTSWGMLCINCIKHGQLGYTFLWFWLYGQCMFGEIVFIQSVLNRAKFAGIAASMIYFICAFVYVPVLLGTGPTLTRIFNIMPQSANWSIAVNWAYIIGRGADIDSESIKVWVYSAKFEEDLIMMTTGGFLFFFLGLYLDAVIPKEFGKNKHPCFMFMPSSYTWCCKKSRSGDIDDFNQTLIDANNLSSNQLPSPKSALDNSTSTTGGDLMELENLAPDSYEPAPPEISRYEQTGDYLRIQNLQKTYGNGFQAVKGLNIKMYNNQIFALLGQNGAGKSTTISMLTGLIQPSQGTANVFNTNMIDNLAQVRKFMGVCPQHDVLFDLLTPQEHLSIFYDFKGGDKEKKEREIADLIRDVGLTTDQKKVSSSLSGGNKRKLSVAIAMCGQSRLILLDEPTAGMDLSARRQMWDMLKNYRREKIIILTTHYMDEADVLGDRIGIMAKGQLLCLGSSLFLKNRFGAGFKLTMVKKEKKNNTQVEPYLKRYLNSVKLLQEVSSEITFGIRQEEAEQFKNFFEEFDQVYHTMGIESYGISITTLEEVFINLNKENGITDELALAAEMEDRDQENNGGADASRITRSPNGNLGHTTFDDSRNTKAGNFNSLYTTEVDQESSQPLATQRLINDSSVSSNIRALLWKRYLIYRRDRLSLVSEVIMPFFLVLIGCLFTLYDYTQVAVTTQISTWGYEGPQLIVMNNYTIADSDVDPIELYNNLPNISAGFWEVEWNDTTDWTTFYNLTYEQQYQVTEDMPNRMASYYIYKADKANQQWQFSSFLNITSEGSVAYFPQFMYQSILKTATDNPDFSYSLTTQPYPALYHFKQVSQTGNSYCFLFMQSIGLALIPTVMIGFILREREENQKHMQLVSGMSLPAYWASNMLADILKAYIPVLVIMALAAAFNAYYKGMWVIYLLYPIALVPFTYITSFLFKHETTAQVNTLFFHFAIGGILAPLAFFLEYVPFTFTAGDSMRWWLCICPTYMVSNAVLWSSTGMELLVNERASKPDDWPQLNGDLWSFFGMGGDVAFLLAHFVIDTLILCIIELDIFAACRKFTFRKIPEPNQALVLDDDVLAEEQRVRETRDEVIRVSDFRKAYTSLAGQPFLAVERISFGLNYGECFCLLGVNGAGKSSTFKSLTADTFPTSGQINISKYDIPKQFGEARKLIGYCPQKDAIFPLISVEEHLYFYCRLKGIPLNMHKRVVEKTIAELSLQDQRKKLAGTLSGGNKRKLSVGMATVGNPPIVLLDEPSAGMDPEARRFMWSVVAKISQRDKNSAVILTTHSMEEAEALCTKMGIMVRGGIFKCFGSTQHIKNKFGTGYEMEIKIRRATYDELKELSVKLGLGNDLEKRIKLSEVGVKVGRLVDRMIIEQIHMQGLGSDLANEAQGNQNGDVRLLNLLSFFYVMTAGFKYIDIMTGLFPQIDLIEQCSDFFKFRVPREDKTIGWLFGQIQQVKAQLNISEYAVSQTSLEQIFATFANMTIENTICLTFKKDEASGLLKLLNPDRKTDMSVLSSGRGEAWARVSDQGKKNRPLIEEDEQVIIEDD